MTTYDGIALIRDNELSFDPGDKQNGSLYVCRPPASPASATEAAIAQLRAAGLWSDQPVKTVADDQKPAYQAQMIFVEAVDVGVAGQKLILARYNHPKFPSSGERFAAWKACLA
ncbi:MAG TPA: hypothetical protein VN667_05850 [Burkholderiales bacterium]|nr:hypothetical protein [Burkholderiales bacterium]